MSNIYSSYANNIVKGLEEAGVSTVPIKKSIYNDDLVNIPVAEAVEKNLIPYINSVGLEDLPEPVFVDVSEEAIQNISAEIKAEYENKMGKKLLDTDVDSMLIEIFAYREALTRISMQEGLKQNLVQYAKGIILDHLGRLVGVERKTKAAHELTLRFVQTVDTENVKATGEVSFVRLPSVYKNVKIPAGTRVETADGTRVYITRKDAYIIHNNDYSLVGDTAVSNGAGEEFVKVPVEAMYVGREYNFKTRDIFQLNVVDNIYGIDSIAIVETDFTGGIMQEGIVEIPRGTKIGAAKTEDLENPNHTLIGALPEGVKEEDLFFVTSGYNDAKISEYGYVDVKAKAEHAEEYYGYVDLGQVSVIEDSSDNITIINKSEVENIDFPIGYSSETEDDEDLRQRILLAPYRYTNAGSKGAYEYHVRSIIPADDIQELRIWAADDKNGIPPGEVHIFLLQKKEIPIGPEEEGRKILTGGKVSAEISEYITDSLKKSNVVPLTDTPRVITVEPHSDYPVSIEVDIKTYSDVNSAKVKSEALSKLYAYVAHVRASLGRDVIKSELISWMMNIPEVYYATVKFTDMNGEVMMQIEDTDAFNEYKTVVADYIRIAPQEYFNFQSNKIEINSIKPMENEPLIY